MPLRTRQDMHIGIELGVNLLNSNKYYKLEPEVKDYFLNKAIDAFVDETIYKNSPDISNQLGLSHEQILKKYNQIYTLIKQAPLTLNTKTTTPPIPSYREATLPTDMYHFEGSVSKINSTVTPGTTIETVNNLPQLTDVYSVNTHPYSKTSLIPNTTIINNKFRIFDFNKFVINSVDIIYIKYPNKLSASRLYIPYSISTNNVSTRSNPQISIDNIIVPNHMNVGSHVYYVTYILNGIEIVIYKSSPITTDSTNNICSIEHLNIPVGATDIKIYRTLTNDNNGIPYFVGYNGDPGTGNSTTRYYDGKNDADIINNSQIPFVTSTDCDLPSAYHDEIIDRTVSMITAITNLPNYQQIINELSKTK